ncbi:nucleotide exchange factor GrpE [uncultured Treponema sp.]|uniref:nucleotide exchange factor GrpE n=1 Tax=uncultured Treponema sp. TaxID=162155 RepID=UPI002596D6D3|nr:nucleotide exchange factor GrpE [uncultured Treponema sp.]
MDKKNHKAEENSAENQNENKAQDAEKTEEKGSQSEESKTSEQKNDEPAVKTSEERIAELEAQIEQMKKDALYKAAENDNWRKRMLQQKEDAVAYANESLLSDLLDSLDNFDRTLDAAKDVKEAKPIVDGIKLTNKSLVSMLENKYNLVAFGKEGDDFDPELHEAIGMQEGDVKKEQLLQVYLKGYKLKDRVIRHAKVMVIKPKA